MERKVFGTKSFERDPPDPQTDRPTSRRKSTDRPKNGTKTGMERKVFGTKSFRKTLLGERGWFFQNFSFQKLFIP